MNARPDSFRHSRGPRQLSPVVLTQPVLMTSYSSCWFSALLSGRLHLYNGIPKQKLRNRISTKILWQCVNDPHTLFNVTCLQQTFLLLLLFILKSFDQGISNRGFRIHLQWRGQQRKLFLRVIPKFAPCWPKGASGQKMKFRLHFSVFIIFSFRLCSLPGALRK